MDSCEIYTKFVVLKAIVENCSHQEQPTHLVFLLCLSFFNIIYVVVYCFFLLVNMSPGESFFMLFIVLGISFTLMFWQYHKEYFYLSIIHFYISDSSFPASWFSTPFFCKYIKFTLPYLLIRFFISVKLIIHDQIPIRKWIISLQGIVFRWSLNLMQDIWEKPQGPINRVLE